VSILIEFALKTLLHWPSRFYFDFWLCCCPGRKSVHDFLPRITRVRETLLRWRPFYRSVYNL